jgi:hypothetical protein
VTTPRGEGEVSAESIGKTACLGGCGGREALKLGPARHRCGHRGPKPGKPLPREAAWSIRGVEMERQNGNSGLSSNHLKPPLARQTSVPFVSFTGAVEYGEPHNFYHNFFNNKKCWECRCG